MEDQWYRISAEALNEFVVAILVKMGLPKQDAEGKE
jgi:LDH2 family malate/lactate/ureidoglycolate dehydrogenase